MNKLNEELLSPYDPKISEEDFQKYVDEQIAGMRKRRESLLGAMQDTDMEPNKDQWETLEKETREHYWSQRELMKKALGSGEKED